MNEKNVFSPTLSQIAYICKNFPQGVQGFERKLSDLKQRNFSKLNLERIHDKYPIYSIRYSEKGRLILAIIKVEGTRRVLLMQDLEDHKYQKLRHGNYEKIFSDYAQFIETNASELIEIAPEASAEDVFGFVEDVQESELLAVQYHDKRLITLSSTQKELQNKIAWSGHCAVLAPMGFGKTLTIEGLIHNNLVSEVPEVLYVVVPTESLREQIRQNTAINDPERHEKYIKIKLFSECFAFNKPAGEQEFVDWVKPVLKKQGHLKKESYVLATIAPEILYEECKIIGGYYSENKKGEYLSLQSTWIAKDNDAREQMWGLYGAYIKFLGDENRDPCIQKIDLGWKEQDSGLRIIVDEAHNLSLAQILSLLHQSSSVNLFLDTNQQLSFLPGFLSFLAGYFTLMKDNIESHRASKGIASLLNMLFAWRRIYSGGVSDKDEILEIKATEKAREGSVHFFEKLPEKDNSIKNLLERQAYSGIIIPHEGYRKKIEGLFGENVQIYTVAESQGLQFNDCVLVWDPFQRDTVCNQGVPGQKNVTKGLRELSNALAEDKKDRPHKNKQRGAHCIEKVGLTDLLKHIAISFSRPGSEARLWIVQSGLSKNMQEKLQQKIQSFSQKDVPILQPKVSTTEDFIQRVIELIKKRDKNALMAARSLYQKYNPVKKRTFEMFYEEILGEKIEGIRKKIPSLRVVPNTIFVNTTLPQLNPIKKNEFLESYASLQNDIESFIENKKRNVVVITESNTKMIPSRGNALYLYEKEFSYEYEFDGEVYSIDLKNNPIHNNAVQSLAKGDMVFDNESVIDSIAFNFFKKHNKEKLNHFEKLLYLIEKNNKIFVSLVNALQDGSYKTKVHEKDLVKTIGCLLDDIYVSKLGESIKNFDSCFTHFINNETGRKLFSFYIGHNSINIQILITHLSYPSGCKGFLNYFNIVSQKRNGMEVSWVNNFLMKDDTIDFWLPNEKQSIDNKNISQCFVFRNYHEVLKNQLIVPDIVFHDRHGLVINCKPKAINYIFKSINDLVSLEKISANIYDILFVSFNKNIVRIMFENGCNVISFSEIIKARMKEEGETNKRMLSDLLKFFSFHKKEENENVIKRRKNLETLYDNPKKMNDSVGLDSKSINTRVSLFKSFLHEINAINPLLIFNTETSEKDIFLNIADVFSRYKFFPETYWEGRPLSTLQNTKDRSEKEIILILNIIFQKFDLFYKFFANDINPQALISFVRFTSIFRFRRIFSQYLRVTNAKDHILSCMLNNDASRHTFLLYLQEVRKGNDNDEIHNVAEFLKEEHFGSFGERMISINPNHEKDRKNRIMLQTLLSWFKESLPENNDCKTVLHN